MSLALAGNAALLVLSALDHRFGWSSMPAYVSLAGNTQVALGSLIDFFVFRENSYGGSTVETESIQRVISTGPRGRVYQTSSRPSGSRTLIRLWGCCWISPASSSSASFLLTVSGVVPR